MRASVDYSGWDADSIQGCVCDNGYSGYDCSERTCPYGFDPLSKISTSRESYELLCNANAGSFNIQLLGRDC